MAKKRKNSSGSKTRQDNTDRSPVNKRPWIIRAVLLTVLTFAFVMWQVYPARGNVAFLWAFGLSAAMLAWVGASYYFLNR